MFNTVEINNTLRKAFAPVLVAGSLVAAVSPVYSLQEGDIAIKGGISYAMPGDLTLKLKDTKTPEKIKVRSDDAWTVGISALMMFSDKLGLEIGTVWATKFKGKSHRRKGDVRVQDDANHLDCAVLLARSQ